MVNAYAGSFQAERAVNLEKLGQLAESCDARTLSPQMITTGLAPGFAVEPPVECAEINKRLYQQAILVSSLACDDFLDYMYEKQRNLRDVDQWGNLAIGTAAALSGFLKWGSVVGAAIGLGSTFFNQAIELSADSLLFGIPAATIGSLVRAQQNNARTTFETKNTWDYVSVQIAAKDYFRICLPVNIETFLTESVIATRNSFLNKKLTDQAAADIRRNALDHAARQFGRVLHQGTTLASQVEIMSVYALIRPTTEFNAHINNAQKAIGDRWNGSTFAWEENLFNKEKAYLAKRGLKDPELSTATESAMRRKLTDYAVTLEAAFGRADLIEAALAVLTKLAPDAAGKVKVMNDDGTAIEIPQELLSRPSVMPGSEFNPNTLYNPGGVQ
ncbi:hypothetical protein [Dongia mobilis]|uniref:hypothetical protein n=1 Tax=Dongia mobilis TaxID=578943 RepID=UPI00105FEA5A|nr:hypothetical protein [Dongia mobilis]